MSDLTKRILLATLLAGTLHFSAHTGAATYTLERPMEIAQQPAGGFDVADNEIVKRLQQDDLVITTDISLAAEVVEKGGHAINPRGERYTNDNIK